MAEIYCVVGVTFDFKITHFDHDSGDRPCWLGHILDWVSVVFSTLYIARIGIKF